MKSQHLVPLSKELLAPQLDYWLVDGSGSMLSKWYDLMAGMDGFLDVMRRNNIHSHGIVHEFSDGNDLMNIQRDSTLLDWPNFTVQRVEPSGLGTALYDAINLTGRRLRELDPPNASVVIVTDGEENGSKHTDLAQASSIINWMRAKGWQVTFLGCDFNNLRQAKALGVSARNSIGVQKARMTDAGKLLGDRRVRHARSGTEIAFTDDERTEFGGYLTNGGSGK
jgi:hypothetical protein